LFADDNFGINRQGAAVATSDSAETKAKVTLRCNARDAIEQAIDARRGDGLASQVGRDKQGCLSSEPRGAGAVISLVARSENCVHHSSETRIENEREKLSDS
jgi:hypothetical protein